MNESTVVEADPATATITVEPPKPDPKDPSTWPIGARFKKPANRGANGGECRLPSGYGYKPHIGTRQRLREFNRAWAAWEKLCKKEPWARTTNDRMLDYFVEAFPNEHVEQTEFRAKALVLASKLFAEKHQATWTGALNQALNELEEKLPKYVAAV